MKILLLLGPNDEYLDYKIFETEDEVDQWVDDHMDLVLANIEGDKPLKQRLKLCPEYFPFAGRLRGWEIIDLERENTYEQK